MFSWLKKPITWGDYLALCGISAGIGLAYSAVVLIQMGWIDFDFGKTEDKPEVDNK